VPYLAYPNGSPRDFSATVIEYAQEVGYEAAVTTIAGHPTKEVDVFRLPRFLPDASSIRFEALVSGWEARIRRLPR
jgi:hypothetical protein